MTTMTAPSTEPDKLAKAAAERVRVAKKKAASTGEDVDVVTYDPASGFVAARVTPAGEVEALVEDRYASMADAKAALPGARRAWIAKTTAPPAPAAPAAPAGRVAWPVEIKVAARRGRELSGKTHSAGPKQHAHVREVVVAYFAELGGPVTPQNLATLAGADSLATLFAMAAHEAPLTPELRELGARMGDDRWCKGRYLAGALAAWCDELADSADWQRIRDALGGRR